MVSNITETDLVITINLDETDLFILSTEPTDASKKAGEMSWNY